MQAIRVAERLGWGVGTTDGRCGQRPGGLAGAGAAERVIAQLQPELDRVDHRAAVRRVEGDRIPVRVEREAEGDRVDHQGAARGDLGAGWEHVAPRQIWVVAEAHAGEADGGATGVAQLDRVREEGTHLVGGGVVGQHLADVEFAAGRIQGGVGGGQHRGGRWAELGVNQAGDVGAPLVHEGLHIADSLRRDPTGQVVVEHGVELLGREGRLQEFAQRAVVAGQDARVLEERHQRRQRVAAADHVEDRALRVGDRAPVTLPEDRVEVVWDEDEAGVGHPAVDAVVVVRAVRSVGLAVGEDGHAGEPAHPLVEVRHGFDLGDVVRCRVGLVHHPQPLVEVRPIVFGSVGLLAPAVGEVGIDVALAVGPVVVRTHFFVEVAACVRRDVGVEKLLL